MKTVKFGSVSAGPGEVASGRWRALQLSDGSWVEFPVMIANGTKDGPTVYLGALIHGDEYSGIGVLHGVMAAMDFDDLRGGLVVVPIQNPVAHRDRGRLTLIVQSDETNMHRVWPGHQDGDSSQRMARMLFEAMREAEVDLVLDFHSGTRGQECAPHTFVPATDGSESNAIADEAFEYASMFDLGVVMRAEGGAYANASWMEHALAAHGIPAFGIELGLGGVIQESYRSLGVESTLNLLRLMGMYPGESRKPSEQRVMVDERWIRANMGGFVAETADIGIDVKEGDLLGATVDAFGDVAEEFLAPCDGYLMNLRREPVISTGERLCRLGIERP